MPRATGVRKAGQSAGFLRRLLWIAAVALAIYGTGWLPIRAVIGLLVTLDAAALVYWWRVNAARQASTRPPTPLAPMRSLAGMLKVAGLLLIGTAVWITILGFLRESGLTGAGMTDWSDLAMAGFDVRADQPVAFGLRFLVVAIAVWIVGFSLTKTSGEKA
jgi:hypothetical protein